MLAQVAGFALLAAVSPAALLVIAVFLGSANPRAIALAYLAGAVVMTTAMGITFLVVLRAVGLNQPRQHAPRYGLRLALGILALAVCGYLIQRARHPGHKAAGDKPRRPGLITRFTARPRPLTGFLAGLLLFAPSTTFFAAVQVIATSKSSVPLTIAAMVIAVALTAAAAWLPLVTYLAVPGATTRTLGAANAWLAAHGQMLVVTALTIAGTALVIDGAVGLAQR
jgi:hypothetical protein